MKNVEISLKLVAGAWIMSKVYVLASICGQGKTMTALALERHFKGKGLKVACLQSIKGQFDTGLYLKHGSYHYSIPLEGAKNQETFEKWLPKGFDIYLMEVSFAYGPMGAAYLELFRCFNEVVSYNAKQDWKNYVQKYLLAHYQNSDMLIFWDEIHDRDVQEITTKSPVCQQGPCVDKKYNIYQPEKFVSDTLEPKMVLPRSEKKAIAVGAFPGEFWDIFPDLTWYGYNYHIFMKRLKEENFDVVIIGQCINDHLKLNYHSKNALTICYQPSLYLDCQKTHHIGQANTDFRAVYRTIKEKPVGTPLGDDSSPYMPYNNKFWVYQQYSDPDIVWRDENMIYCNGWVLPQYLIREGYLEV